MFLALVVLAILILIVVVLYAVPTPKVPFEQLYAGGDDEISRDLKMFRRDYPPKYLEVDGTTWEYLALGQGDEAILFLHGMGGGYDIWWQQIEALQDRYRVLSVTYPPVEGLEALSRGVAAVLAQEGVSSANVVGSSLGGYFAQYLVSRQPTRIKRAIFGNTFPPNELIAHGGGMIWKLMPFLPEWMIMRFFRQVIARDLYPASGGSELVRAYLLEQSYGKMSKAQFVARYSCVIDPFTPPDPQALGIPVMIIEADNDPSVAETLREQLKEAYPSAGVHTLPNVGHFPYLNEPEVYTRLIERFLADEI